MSKRGDIELLDDISEAIRRLEIYSQNMGYEDFLEDTKTQDAVIRNLEIIGEAAKNITDELKEKHPKILWKDLAGIRDKLIHHYFGVNLEIVWTIIDEDLPQLRKEIRQVKELIEIAVAHYRERKISLAKAASIAGISLTEMKELLLEKGINPRLGVEDVRELEEDYEALKES